MINSLKVKRKDGEIIEIKLRELKLSDINKIIKLQELIINGLENKELYADSKQEEFEEYINCNGKIIGCLTNEDELIAMGVYAKSEYRGNKLQRLICEELEKIARKDNIEILSATASPYNEFSVNTFMNLGYEIKKDKLKYGGLRRYVLVKEL